MAEIDGKSVPGSAAIRDDHPFTFVPIEVRVTVGRARPTVGELLNLRPEAVLALDRGVEDPVELFVGDRLIGRGELQELDGENAGQLAVRLTEVAQNHDRP